MNFKIRGNDFMRHYTGQSKRSRAVVIIVVLACVYLVLAIISLLSRNKSAKANAVSEGDSSEPLQYEIAVSSEDTESWMLILVNRWNPAPDNYEKGIEFVKLKYDQAVDERIYPDLQQMMDDCRAEGLKPMVCSGYRSIEKQTQLFNAKVKEYLNQGYSKEKARSEAEQWVAVPGTSEHHLGIAVDIISENYQYLDEKQEQTAEQQWLLKNCWKYGFILRYPSDKSELTGIHYEPWHYRYVGKTVAEYITKNNLCLEEYLKIADTEK